MKLVIAGHRSVPKRHRGNSEGNGPGNMYLLSRAGNGPEVSSYMSKGMVQEDAYSYTKTSFVFDTFSLP